MERKTREEAPKSKSKLLPDGKRQLPEDPTELEKAINSCRLPASMLVGGIGEAFVIGKVRPMNKTEKDQGEEAIAAWLYENEIRLSGTILVICWALAVILPRALEFLKQLADEKAKKKPGALIAEAQKANEPPENPALVNVGRGAA